MAIDCALDREAAGLVRIESLHDTAREGVRISGTKEIRSTSFDGYSLIEVEFNPEAVSR